MPRSTLPALSRRRFLASSARAATLAGAGGAALVVAACTGDRAPDTIIPEDLLNADPLALELTSIAGVREPGSDEPISVTFQGRRIIQVGEPVDGARVVDLAGGYVIPGFIDSHVHMHFSNPADVLAGGVTGVRDLGGPVDGAQSLIGKTPLKVLIAGRILTPVGGYPTLTWGADGTGREVRGEDDAELAVQEQVAAGATTIKIALEDSGGQPLMDVATIQRITAAAAASGLRSTAHVGSSLALERALEGGVRELCHLPLHEVSGEEMVRVAEAGIVLVPTLEIRGPGQPALDALRAFREAGGDVLYGSDLGNGGTAPGIEVTEVQMMLGAGMTPAEVLRAATADAAAYHQLDTGQLAADRVADIVVLGADPFADPQAYDDIRMVVASGEVVGP